MRHLAALAGALLERLFPPRVMSVADQLEAMTFGGPDPEPTPGRFCENCQRWFPEGYGRHVCLPPPGAPGRGAG